MAVSRKASPLENSPPSLTGSHKFEGARPFQTGTETVVAEKFQALVELGMLNTRLKDFYDLWAIAATFHFDGPLLVEALRATFARRATELPAETPVALSPAFAAAPGKQAQWDGFLRRTAIAMAPEPITATLAKLEIFLMPPARAGQAGASFPLTWAPGGPWR